MSIKKIKFSEVVGPHPASPHPCGVHFGANDTFTAHRLPHRELDTAPLNSDEFANAMGAWIVQHHLSPEAAARHKLIKEALARQGFTDLVQRFPTNPTTKKGNWAEILLAEYIKASCPAQLPVYRLRYNPNVDQSMKGDDVLAFDFDSDPVRVIVGEAKFRSTPTKAVVEELVASLLKSHSGNIPASLQFVADRLYESGNEDLGSRVLACNAMFAEGKLRLEYVGLLVSNQDSHRHVERNAKSELRRLAVISLGFDDPEQIVDVSYTQARKDL